MDRTNQNKIIIIETNQGRRDFLKATISGWGYIPFSFEKETMCLDNLQPLNPGLVISGPLSLERTFRFITTLKMINSSLSVLIISDDHAVKDFIDINGFADVTVIRVTSEPFEIQEAISRIQTNRSQNKVFQDNPIIIGQHPTILNIKKMIPELGRSKDTIFIKGETGTGKELIAKAIHCRSVRRDNPFIKINAAELQRELFDDKLFGQGTGSVPDYLREIKGKVEVANTGTLYIDEVENIPASLQANLLYLLEEDSVARFGPVKNEKNDVRIVASTKVDLNSLVAKGKFRKDIYYRLNILSMEIPPLRNRSEDISRLTDYFVDQFCTKYGKSYYEFPTKTKNLFCRYYWPENVRELKSLIKTSILLDNEENIADIFFRNNKNCSPNDFFDSNDGILTLEELSDLQTCVMHINKWSLKEICREFVSRAERKFMKRALERTNWNRKKAATMLNISYKSLLNKIKAYDLA